MTLNPSFAAAHRNLGTLYLLRQEYSAAEEALLRALRLEADVAATYHYLGILYSRTGRQEQARDAFATAKKLGPAATPP